MRECVSIKHIKDTSPSLLLLIVMLSSMPMLSMFFMVAMVFVIAVMVVLAIGGRLRGGLRPRRRALRKKSGRRRGLGFAEGLEQFFQFPSVQPDAPALGTNIQFDAGALDLGHSYIAVWANKQGHGVSYSRTPAR